VARSVQVGHFQAEISKRGETILFERGLLNP